VKLKLSLRLSTTARRHITTSIRLVSQQRPTLLCTRYQVQFSAGLLDFLTSFPYYFSVSSSESPDRALKQKS